MIHIFRFLFWAPLRLGLSQSMSECLNVLESSMPGGTCCRVRFAGAACLGISEGTALAEFGDGAELQFEFPRVRSSECGCRIEVPSEVWENAALLASLRASLWADPSRHLKSQRGNVREVRSARRPRGRAGGIDAGAPIQSRRRALRRSGA